MAETEERLKPGILLSDENEKNHETQRLIEIDSNMGSRNLEEETLYVVLDRLFSAIFTQNPNYSLLERIKTSINDNEPSLREASRNFIRKLLLWTREGSPFRALLVITVGTIILLAVTGLLVFLLFFLAATIGAVLMSLFVSLAAVGGFFVCLVAIYILTLLMAAFIIATATISTIIASLIVTGWIGLFWTLWLMTKKSVGFVEHLIGSIFSVYSAPQQVHNHEPDKSAE